MASIAITTTTKTDNHNNDNSNNNKMTTIQIKPNKKLFEMELDGVTPYWEYL